jgi:GT2 family glycosyltransferase
MATQIVHVDLRADPAVIQVRDDVQALFVVVTMDDRPVDLRCLPRPADGVFRSDSVLRSPASSLAAPPASTSRFPTAPVSVIIPTRERPYDLTRCLASLARAQRDGHEVIVVDNAPATADTRAVAARFGARYVLEPTRGLNRARNAGVAAATHEIVAFVDDDVVIGPAWLGALSSCFENPDVDAATGLVLPLELETPAQEEFEVYSTHLRALRRRVFSRDVLWPAAAGEIGMGANMAFRRGAVLAQGGFDLRLGPPTRTRAGDEIDLFARLLDAGRRIVYTPDAYVWHRHRRTAAEVRSCAFGYGVGTFSMLTKRVVEGRDPAALIIAAWWFIGPLIRVARAKVGRRPAPPWSVVLAETAGAAVGPFCFGYEAWRARSRPVPCLSPGVGH